MALQTPTFIPSLATPPANLPITRYRREILYLLESHQVVIVLGQTGSGKTTQLPQFLAAAGWCGDGAAGTTQRAIAVTQPRRIVAVSVAARVAAESGTRLGEEVGYAVRFEEQGSERTRIRFVTDGWLLREMLRDPLLERYSVVVVDEAHERSLNSDVLLGLLKRVLRRRPGLRVVVSSATLEAGRVREWFNNAGEGGTGDVAGVICVEGRAHEVDILHTERPAEDYIGKAADTVFKIHEEEGDGDILVFLTGREEIVDLHQRIADTLLEKDEGDLQVLELYASITIEQQMYIFEPAPAGVRKVILATNIAEVSLTIEGIGFVIDCGFVKLKSFDPASGIEALRISPISKASALQRAGRAGRTKPGKCFRLYPESVHQSMEQNTAPEIQRSNLAGMLLQLKALGIENVARFDFLSPPPSQAMSRGLELLFSLGALDEYAKLTKPLGVRLAQIAIEPMMGKALLSSATFGCLSEVLSIAAMTGVQGNIWFENDTKKLDNVRRKFAAEEGDHLTLLNVYQAFVIRGKQEAKWSKEHGLNHKLMLKAVSIRAQLVRSLDGFGVQEEGGLKNTDRSHQSEQIRRCLTTGYFAHAARMRPDGTFATIGGTILWAHPKSLMFTRKADWVIFGEVIEIGEKKYIEDVTAIDKNWLLEYSAGFYRKPQKQ